MGIAFGRRFSVDEPRLKRLGKEDAWAERRVIEICDRILRRLDELEPPKSGLEGEIQRRRRPR